jgi:POT family proton-dependent oligopeptide transporter
MNEVALKQPRGLSVLFFAEVWERFGFYCVQTLLVLYLTQKLLWTDKPAFDLFTAFSALIYATPVIGGFLADKFLGYRQAIYIGTGLYILGYFCMGSSNPVIFNLALAALICGNGFFKPNVSSLLGKLYGENDPRRESGFTWFYMGINIGSFLSPLICTYIAYSISWHYAFMTAGIGMLICLVTCLKGFKHLEDKGLPPIKINLFINILFYIGLAGSLFGIGFLLQHSKWVSDAVIGIGVIAFLVLFISAFFENKIQRHKLIALIILMIFSILFWAIYVQTFSSLTLFTERNVDRHIFGSIIPTGMFQSINPFFIIVLSPLLAILWLKLNQSSSKLNLSVAMKFALALILIGVGFLSLILAMKISGVIGLIGMGWLVWSYFLQTVGELSLSPIGLSAVTALSPPRLTGMVMGLWFLSLSAAYAVGGKLADLTAVPDKMVDPAVTGPIYYTHFFQFGVAGVGIGIILVFLAPYLKKMMEGN